MVGQQQWAQVHQRWNTHYQRLETHLLLKILTVNDGNWLVFQHISDAFSREVLPLFVKSQFEYTPTFVESSFDAQIQNCSRWRINHLILTFQSQKCVFQVSTLNRSCLHQRSKSRSAQITHSWLAKTSHKKPLELLLFDGNHHESSVLPHYHIINRLFTIIPLLLASFKRCFFNKALEGTAWTREATLPHYRGDRWSRCGGYLPVMRPSN
jgi:hypothetical protein